jgi:hypothetical protein
LRIGGASKITSEEPPLMIDNIFITDIAFMKRSISERFLYGKENNDIFAIPLKQSISFQSSKFGATYKTEETNDKNRLFQIQVFETKASTKCLVKIDEENDLHVSEQFSQDELYGIIYDHVQKVDSLDSKDAVEAFKSNLNEIL